MSLPRGAGSFHFIYFTTIIALAKLLYFVPFHLSGQAARHYQPPGYTGITDVQPHKIAARVHAEACINLRRHRTTQRDLERKPELAIGAPCVDRRRGYDYRTRPNHGTTVLYLDYCEFERTARFKNSHQLSCRPIGSIYLTHLSEKARKMHTHLYVPISAYKTIS